MVTITIPDSERRSEYAPVASTGPFPVGFPIFDNTGADLSVTLDGEEVSGWTLTAEVEAGFYGAPNVWVNASITFGSPITGALVISGNRAPRRVGQYAEGRGIPARDHNTEYNVLTAVQRELYDRQRRLDGLAGELPEALAAAEEFAGLAGDAAASAANSAAAAGTAGAAATAVVAGKTDRDGQNLTGASGWRTALGLGDSATRNVGTAAGTVAAGDDARLSDTRTPSALSILNSMVSASAAIIATKLAYVASSFSRTIDSKLRERITPQDFGAAGNGSTDDTAAFQAAVTYCVANKRTLWLYGDYRITSTIALTAGTQSGAAGYSLCIRGADDEASLLHAFNDHLFLCTTGAPAFFKARDFKIVSTSAKSSPKVAFYFNGGITRSEFSNIRYGSDGNAANDPWGFFTAPGTTTTDTITFDQIYVESATGVVYDIAQGSSIYFYGGRIIGKNRTSGSIGIRLLGGNGGVWTRDIDIINLDRGMHITQLNSLSNREIFIGNMTAFDGCFYGLDIDDTNSYVNIVGCWASAAVEANIRTGGSYDGQLVINGGTIFNGGANAGGSGDGMQINNANTVVLNGVRIRANVGTGVRCLTAGKPPIAAMTGCVVVANGLGMNGQGTWALTGNYFGFNSTDFMPNAGTYKIRGCYGSGLGDAG